MISVPEELQKSCLENKELVWILQQKHSCFNSHKFNFDWLALLLIDIAHLVPNQHCRTHWTMAG